MRRQHFILSCLLFVAACGKNGDDLTAEERLEKYSINVPLGQCATTTVGKKKVQVCFDKLIEDSRCPREAICDWDGEASVRLTVGTASNLHSFDIKKYRVSAGYEDTLIDGYRVTLMEVYPYPGETAAPAVKVSVSIR